MTKKELSPYKMNLPLELKQRLEHAAIDSRRSLSAEIIARLEASFSGTGEDPGDKMMRLLSALETALKGVSLTPGGTIMTADLHKKDEPTKPE